MISLGEAENNLDKCPTLWFDRYKSRMIGGKIRREDVILVWNVAEGSVIADFDVGMHHSCAQDHGSQSDLVQDIFDEWLSRWSDSSESFKGGAGSQISSSPELIIGFLMYMGLSGVELEKALDKADKSIHEFSVKLAYSMAVSINFFMSSNSECDALYSARKEVIEKKRADYNGRSSGRL